MRKFTCQPFSQDLEIVARYANFRGHSMVFAKHLKLGMVKSIHIFNNKDLQRVKKNLIFISICNGKYTSYMLMIISSLAMTTIILPTLMHNSLDGSRSLI